LPRTTARFTIRERDESNAREPHRRVGDGVERGRGKLRRRLHGHERLEQRRLLRRYVRVFLEHVGVVVRVGVFVRIYVRLFLGLFVRLRLLVGLVLRFFFGDIVGLLVRKLDELRKLRG
jgi:hypothetical protein